MCTPYNRKNTQPICNVTEFNRPPCRKLCPKLRGVEDSGLPDPQWLRLCHTSWADAVTLLGLMSPRAVNSWCHRLQPRDVHGSIGPAGWVGSPFYRIFYRRIGSSRVSNSALPFFSCSLIISWFMNHHQSSSTTSGLFSYDI